MAQVLKFLTTPADMFGEVVKSVDEKTGIIVSHPTIAIEDRDGDIVDVGDGKETGLILAAYKTNPVGLWQHGIDSRGMVPVYSVTDIATVKVKRHDALETTEKWAIDNPEDPFPRVLFRMHATNPPMLRARSIRFAPDAAMTEKRDASQGWKGYHFKKAELREISAVAIGANPLALAAAVKTEAVDMEFLVEHGVLKGMADGDRLMGVVGDLLKDELQSAVDAKLTEFKTEFDKRLAAVEPRPDARLLILKAWAEACKS